MTCSRLQGLQGFKAASKDLLQAQDVRQDDGGLQVGVLSADVLLSLCSVAGLNNAIHMCNVQWEIFIQRCGVLSAFCLVHGSWCACATHACILLRVPASR